MNYTIGSTGLPTISMTIGAKLDFPFDWSKWLIPVSETIVSHTTTLTAGLSLVSDAQTSTTVVPFVIANAIGEQRITVDIVTTLREDSRTIVISVVPVR